TGAEGFLLGQISDGIVLTVLAHSTQRAVAKRVHHDLDLCNVRILGVAMQEAPTALAWEQSRSLALRMFRDCWSACKRIRLLAVRSFRIRLKLKLGFLSRTQNT